MGRVLAHTPAKPHGRTSHQIHQMLTVVVAWSSCLRYVMYFRFCDDLVFSRNRARQLYKNISMLFQFPVKDVKLSTGVNAQRFISCYG